MRKNNYIPGFQEWGADFFCLGTGLCFMQKLRAWFHIMLEKCTLIKYHGVKTIDFLRLFI